MYIEEPKREINWGNVIKKGILIILVAIIIFLIIWLFTRNNSHAINVNYDENSNNNTLNDKYSEIFINNYRYFHDTAKEYFLISNLPENGKTLKFTLQELIDNALVLPFSYTNKENCDTEASYVSVKNVDGKYTMTTTLICGKEIATTKEELGCNQICENNIKCDCNCNTTTEYEYKQAYKTTETTYSCPSGYTKTGSGENTKCVKSNKDTVAATKNVTYKCEDGYKMIGSGSTAKCEKQGSTTIAATKTTNYSCPSGYTKSGSGSNTTCKKNTSDVINSQVTYTYSCPSGYTKYGSGANAECRKSDVIVTINATATYSCPSGYTKSGSGSNTKCTKNSTISATANSSTSCPSGYTKENGSCVKYIYSKYSTGSYYIDSNGVSYKDCKGGQNVNSPCTSGNCSTSNYVYKCTKGITTTTAYSCPSGYTKSGSGSSTKCTKSETINATPSTIYTCPSGYTSTDPNVACTISTVKEATIIYSCPAGYNTYNNTQCRLRTSSVISPTAKKTYTCPIGYEPFGSGDIVHCSKTNGTNVSVSPTITYEYSCPSGYTKTGSGDNTKCTINLVTKNAHKNTTYSCPSGYTKSGTGTSSICIKTNSATANATKSTKEVTKYKYQWSTLTSINGWERTGKTRQTEKRTVGWSGFLFSRQRYIEFCI